MIRKPYLLFLGDVPDRLAAKVAQGIRDWRPDDVVGQLRLAGCNADLGIADLTVEQAVERGAGTLVVGVANRGGVIADAWLDVMEQALEAGLDLASGLHKFLSDQPRLAEAAARHGRSLHDVRRVGEDYPIASGRRRPGRRCLAVGTDVSVGKMYVSLALQRELARRGRKATFRATGQTGILIEGSGVPLDAVVADFMAGSIEILSPANDDDHWDLIEGQGSLFHASYSGVTLALIHGGQPDALILSHAPSRPHMRGLPDYAMPSLGRLRELALSMARIVNPDCRVIGISINSSAMGEDEAADYVGKVEREFGLPATDPVRFGVGRLADELLQISG